MRSILKKTLLLCSCLLILLSLSSLLIPADDQHSIYGKWVNYTEVKDNSGKTIIKDGEKYYRKLTLVFRPVQTQGAVDDINRRFKMENADGEMNFTESFGDNNEYDEKQKAFKRTHGGYAFDRNNLDLKIVFGGIELRDEKTNKLVLYKKGEIFFNEAQKHIDGIKIIKLEENSLKLKWDYNMNEQIEAGETLTFKSVKD